VLVTVVPTAALAGNATVVLTLASNVVIGALMVAVLVPRLVVNDPAGIVLVPLAVAVTTADTEQLPPGAISEPEDTVSELAPAAAVTVDPPRQVVAGLGVAALVIPAGYTSTNADVNVADTS
jgi:hypothetical protein